MALADSAGPHSVDPNTLARHLLGKAFGEHIDRAF